MGRSRGRKAKAKATSNFKLNMQTLGVKTTGIVLGVPHFVVSLIGHEIAQTEGMLNYLIQGKGIEYYTDRRKMLSESYIDSMDDAILNAVDATIVGAQNLAGKAKDAVKKKPEASQA